MLSYHRCSICQSRWDYRFVEESERESFSRKFTKTAGIHLNHDGSVVQTSNRIEEAEQQQEFVGVYSVSLRGIVRYCCENAKMELIKYYLAAVDSSFVLRIQ